jgi:hypothetical protein
MSAGHIPNILAIFRSRPISWWIELSFTIGVVVSAWEACQFFLAAGFFPQPFYHNPNDTFMDWTNTAFWANNPGAYSVWQSIYPPISFVFLRLFTVHSCYKFDTYFARPCDWMFAWTMSIFYILNCILVFKTFNKIDPSRAWLRTICIGLGLPMLFSIERGQLLIPTFTFFILAHGRVLGSARLKWIANAIAINFKPYLILTILPPLIKRKWIQFEGYIIAGLAVYLITYGIFGVGTPIELLNNISTFSEMPVDQSFDLVYYQSTYQAMINALHKPIPYMAFIGSQPVEILEVMLPAVIRIGQVGVAACFVGAALRPMAVPTHRLAALAVMVAATTSMVGGYTQLLIVFLVFFERWGGVWKTSALLLAFCLSLTVDYTIMIISSEVVTGYLSNRVINDRFGLTLGELMRPAFILLIEYSLVLASFSDILRYRRGEARSPNPGMLPTVSLGSR